MEKIMINAFNRILVTKYNWSLIIFTACAWVSAVMMPYYNKNFDMNSAILSNIILLSIGSMIMCMVGRNPRLKTVGLLAVISFIFSLLAMIFTKSTSLVFSAFGAYLLMPISLFLCFLILKNLWIELDAILANQIK